MKIPVSWLREYVPIDMPIRELADRLVISTCEVDAVTTVGVADTDGNLGLFKVGRVLEAEKHPNADRLQLCRVDVGEGDALLLGDVAGDVAQVGEGFVVDLVPLRILGFEGL
jgi:phenylalanyl-tRNA synthetase beta chain